MIYQLNEPQDDNFQITGNNKNYDRQLKQISWIYHNDFFALQRRSLLFRFDQFGNNTYSDFKLQILTNCPLSKREHNQSYQIYFLKDIYNKLNKRFELFEISAKRVYCTVCQILLKEDSNQDGLFKHYISLNHIDNLTNRVLKTTQDDQSLPKEESIQYESELFNYAQAEEKWKKSLDDLKSYFNQCIICHPEILNGLQQQSATIYIRELKKFYLYLFEEKKKSSINPETIFEYLEQNKTKSSCVMRLFKAFNIPLKYSVKQRLQKYFEEREIKLMAQNNFEELQNKLIQQLEKRKHYKQALAILLSKQGMPPEEVHKIQVKNIPKDNNEAIHLIQKIIEDNPESYLFDQNHTFQQQTRKFLDFRKYFLKSYHQNLEFQRFIRNASLRSIYEINQNLQQSKQNEKDPTNDSQTQDQSNHEEEDIFIDLSVEKEPIPNLRSEQIKQQYKKKVKIIQIKKFVQNEVNQQDQIVIYLNDHYEKQ